MMGGGHIRLLLLATCVLYVSGLPMENYVDAVNYMNGFPENFDEGLPTDEFSGSLPVDQELIRRKRQTDGVSEHIAKMLSTAYEGPPSSDISSLFERNSLQRVVRQSISSDSSRRFPQPFQPKQTFFDNFVQRPVRQQVRKPAPSPTRHSFHQPDRQPIRQPVLQPIRQPVPQPTRQSFQQTAHQQVRQPTLQPTPPSVQVQRGPQRSRFPSFSEAQAEHNRHNEENTNHFTNADDFFESSRIRNKRDVKSQQGIASELDNILSFPFSGTIPSSLESLFIRNTINRVPRKTLDTQQPSSSKHILPSDKSNNHQHFTIPFSIPNFFKNIGFRRSGFGAEDRQGVSGGLSDILASPYQGPVITSIEDLFYRNRKLKKRNPQPFVRPTSQQNFPSQNQQKPNLKQNIVTRFIQPTSNPQLNFFPQTKPQTILNPQVQIQPQIQTDPRNKLIPLPQSPSVTSPDPKLIVHSVGQPINNHQSIRPSPQQSLAGFRPSRSPTNNNHRFHSSQFSSSSYQLIYPSSHVNVQHGRKKREASSQGGNFVIDLTHSGSDFYPAVHPLHSKDLRSKRNPIHQFERQFTKSHPLYRPEFFEQETNFLQNIDESQQSSRNTSPTIPSTPFIRPSVNQPTRIVSSQHPWFGYRQRTRFGPQRPQSPHPRHQNPLLPAFKPGPSPPFHILPHTSIRSPRHIVRQNRRFPRVHRQEDIPVNRRSIEDIGYQLYDVSAEAESRQDTNGFMPDNFPSFESIGGFAKMSDIADQSSSSFVPEFVPPVISIPDIQAEQPEFKIPDHFQKQSLDASEPLYREEVSRSRVAPWILKEKQFSAEENNLQSQETDLSRNRRKTGEPDLMDPSQIPHKRVPRNEKDPESAYEETLIRHVRVPMQQNKNDQEKSGSELLMTKLPLTSVSRRSNVPFFQFPAFESEKVPDRLSHRRFIPDRFTSEFGSSWRNPIISDSDHILPESQRLYPTYNPRRNPFPSSRKPDFFPPTRQPGPLRPRPHFNAHPSTRGPSTRGASPRGPTFRPSHGPGLGPIGFQDFHDPFYGPDFRGGQVAIKKPDFHFPSPPPSREDEYPNENSLLGSGNFEILRGGTFYEPGDYHLNHHPYDHLLDGGYSPFHSNSHSNNYVDDFFSNFRDFSEFAARSDSGEGEHHGFSEPITSFVIPDRDMDHTGEESSINETHAKPQDEKIKSKDESKAKKSDKDNTIRSKSPSHWQAKNIQELLEEIDPRPSHHSTSELIVDEKDPMIAMF